MERREPHRNDDGLLELSTANASYLLHPGSHRQPTRIDAATLRRIDGLVLESGMMRYSDLSIERLRHQPQYASLLSSATAEKMDIFVVDTPYAHSDRRTVLGAGSAIGVPFLAGLAGMAHGTPGLGMLAVPAIAFCAGGGVGGCLPAAAVSYAQLSNAYNSFGIRSAVAAMKLDRWVAPRLTESGGERPTIFVEYGAGHLDIAAYLQHPWIRRAVVRYAEAAPNRLLAAGALRRGCHFRYDADWAAYRKTVCERTF
jgi:hypothetical protein